MSAAAILEISELEPDKRPRPEQKNQARVLIVCYGGLKVIFEIADFIKREKLDPDLVDFEFVPALKFLLQVSVNGHEKIFMGNYFPGKDMDKLKKFIANYRDRICLLLDKQTLVNPDSPVLEFPAEKILELQNPNRSKKKTAIIRTVLDRCPYDNEVRRQAILFLLGDKKARNFLIDLLKTAEHPKDHARRLTLENKCKKLTANLIKKLSQNRQGNTVFVDTRSYDWREFDLKALTEEGLKQADFCVVLIYDYNKEKNEERDFITVATRRDVNLRMVFELFDQQKSHKVILPLGENWSKEKVLERLRIEK